MTPRETCGFCGQVAAQEVPVAHCAVCGMAVSASHFPHLIRIAPDTGPSHLCSVTCMDNLEFLQEETHDD